MPVFGAWFMVNFALEKICDQIVHFFISSKWKIYKKVCFFCQDFWPSDGYQSQNTEKKFMYFLEKSHIFLKSQVQSLMKNSHFQYFSQKSLKLMNFDRVTPLDFFKFDSFHTNLALASIFAFPRVKGGGNFLPFQTINFIPLCWKSILHLCQSFSRKLYRREASWTRLMAIWKSSTKKAIKIIDFDRPSQIQAFLDLEFCLIPPDSSISEPGIFV